MNTFDEIVKSLREQCAYDIFKTGADYHDAGKAADLIAQQKSELDITYARIAALAPPSRAQTAIPRIVGVPGHGDVTKEEAAQVSELMTWALNRRTTKSDKPKAEGRLMELPCKQYTTVYYICDNRVYVGWYLAKVGETTHLILQDRHEMGICWVTDGFWFNSNEDAKKALTALRNNSENCPCLGGKKDASN